MFTSTFALCNDLSALMRLALASIITATSVTGEVLGTWG